MASFFYGDSLCIVVFSAKFTNFIRIGPFTLTFTKTVFLTV